MSGEQRGQLSRSYEQALVGYGYDSSKLLVNKHLMNLKFLGLIAMLFPGAKVVFTHRDPRDTGLSCFLGNFSTRMHPELQSIESIAMVVEQNQRLMDHWKSVLPLEWMDVQYADMIHEQDRVTRSLIEFADLPWDDRVGLLRFRQDSDDLELRSGQQADLFELSGAVQELRVSPGPTAGGMKSSGGLLVDRPVVHFIQEYRVLSMSSMSSLSMMPQLGRLLFVGMALCLASCGDSGPAVSDREIPRPLKSDFEPEITRAFEQAIQSVQETPSARNWAAWSHLSSPPGTECSDRRLPTGRLPWRCP